MNPFDPAFEHPEAEHTACPFWFWNGEMDPDEMQRQIALMCEKNVRAFVIHARVGLEVAYLSDAWFDRCRVALDAAERRGMKVWIYDEDNWPSGYAGGRVLARDPEYVGQNLTLERHYLEGSEELQLELDRPEEVRAVLACQIAEVWRLPPNPLTFHGPVEVEVPWTDTARYAHRYAHEPPTRLRPDGGSIVWVAPEGRWCVFVARQRPTDWIAAYSDCRYVDLMSDGATNAFIEETHERYRERFAHHFGSTVLGFFVDEPGLYNNFWDRNLGSVAWTHDFAREFERRRSRDLLAWLPALWEDLGPPTDAVRLDYWRTVSELLDERFFSKLAGWCETNGVQLTGHLEWEEWLFTMTRHSATPFRALKPFHVPGVDKIDEVTDKLAEKLIASIAHANGRPRVISETFAMIGWKLAPPYMKQIVDQQFVRGVNWLSCHGFYYSTEDFRKRECPPSEFFQNPWWDHSRPLWDYVARLSAVLSQGEHVAPIALYYPTEQAWTTITPGAPPALPPTGVWEPWQLPQPEHPTQRADLSMIRLGLRLLEERLDFDLVDATLVAAGHVAGEALELGHESFRAALVPAVDVMDGPALARLLEFAHEGGTVVFAEVLPGRVVGSDAPPGWREASIALLSFGAPGFLGWGDGQLGFAPAGVDAAVALLRSAVRPDVELTLDADPASVELENRKGGFREARVRRASHALKYHRRRGGSTDLYFLVNESDRPLSGRVSLVGGAAVEAWDPAQGTRAPMSAEVDGQGRAGLRLNLASRQSLLLVLREGTPFRAEPSVSETRILELKEWRTEVDGLRRSGPLVSWTEFGRARFSGVGFYSSVLEVPALGPGEKAVLDLGTVFETVRVSVNGTWFPPSAWDPHRLEVTDALIAGRNDFVLEVANTNANAYEGRERPSGLFGPVRLLVERVKLERRTLRG